MQQFIKFLRFDTTFQLVLILGNVMAAFTIVGLGISLPLLGLWQVISGIVGYRYQKNTERALYLAACALVLTLMAAMIAIGVSVKYEFLLFILFIVIPVGMAIYYFSLTKRTLRELDKEYFGQQDNIEDLLDDELMFG